MTDRILGISAGIGDMRDNCGFSWFSFFMSIDHILFGSDLNFFLQLDFKMLIISFEEGVLGLKFEELSFQFFYFLPHLLQLLY